MPAAFVSLMKKLYSYIYRIDYVTNKFGLNLK